MKISDYDISKENVNMQDTIEDIRNVLNRGSYEIKVTTQSYPNWTEATDGIMVLSIFGASTTLFISNTNVTSKWTYVSLTNL